MHCRRCGRDLEDGSRFCAECGADQVGSAAVPVAHADPRIGTSIEEKYRLDSQIGVGGMATVYRATRLLIGDAVAVKILHAEQLRDPQAAERFRREAQAAARLKHPNAVTIYDFGVSDDGVVYLVMELVEGQSLRQVVKEQGPLFPSGAAEILTQVCGALNEAHEQNVVHRDIKPDNILVTKAPTGIRVKVLDFGIARISDMSNLGNLTQAGSIMGTPHYMSPEQCLGEELDGRSDIYSLGIVLYEMLTGVVPFNSPTSMAVVVHHVNTAPAPLHILNASVPPAVEAVVMRALEKRREARPQTAMAFAGEFSAAVAETLSAPPGRSAPPHLPTMMPTVEMRTPWSAGTALPPQVPTPPGVHGGQATRKRLPATLIGGVAAVLIVGVASVSFVLSRVASPPAVPADAAATSRPAATLQSPPPDRLTPAPSAPPVVSAAPPAEVPVAAARTPGPQAVSAMAGAGASAADSEASGDRGDITIRMLPGSTVQLDGVNVGTASEEGLLVLSRLRPGRHLLVVRKDRYRDVEQTISVVRGQSELIEIQPLPLTGAITATASAPAARFDGDGPQITELSANRLEVEPGQGATLRVSASDPGADPLKFTWTTTAGSIEGRGTIATFKPGPAANQLAGSVTVTVTARNSRGLEARKDIVIKLKPLAAPAAPIAPDAMRRRAYSVGPNIEVWLESPPAKSGSLSGVVEAELETVEGVWQITSVHGNFPGTPITVTPECRNCEFVGIVENPSAANGFMRVRLRVKPVNLQQPMGVLLRYQTPAPGNKK